MTKLRITPEGALLTSGQTATFQALNEKEEPQAVTWSLIGEAPSDLHFDSGGRSAIYVAPAITVARSVVVVAKLSDVSTTATVTLTPNAIVIVPADLDLADGQVQSLRAIVAGTSSEEPTWSLNPPIGKLEPLANPGGEPGRLYSYTAPKSIADSQIVSVTATISSSASAVAKVRLASRVWTGPGVQVLGVFLLLIFCLVFVLLALWPPALPARAVAHSERIEATQELATATTDLDAKSQAWAEAEAAEKKAAKELPPAAQPPGGSEQPDAGSDAGLPPTTADSDSMLVSKASLARTARDRANVARGVALKELQRKLAIEREIDDPFVRTRLVPRISREIDLMLLVLLAGSIGAFLHTAQSYSEYIGNRTLKSQWAWWYALRPFIGSALALVFYGAMRGGFLALSTGANATATDLNPFGVVSLAALVGMFSRAAAVKLGEVFDTLFQSANSKTKDRMLPDPTNTPNPTGTPDLDTPGSTGTSSPGGTSSPKPPSPLPQRPSAALPSPAPSAPIAGSVAAATATPPSSAAAPAPANEKAKP